MRCGRCRMKEFSKVSQLALKFRTAFGLVRMPWIHQDYSGSVLREKVRVRHDQQAAERVTDEDVRRMLAGSAQHFIEFPSHRPSIPFSRGLLAETKSRTVIGNHSCVLPDLLLHPFPDPKISGNSRL